MTKPTLICTLQNCPVWQDAPSASGQPGRVWFVADMDIDADGANGQTKDANGKPIFAYALGDKGADLLKNAGYPNGSFHDILVCPNEHSAPIIFPGGGYHSKTAYQRQGKQFDDPNRYLDSAGLPYFVVEDFIRKGAAGVVLGCQGRITNTRTGKTAPAMVGDLGPLYKIGEASMRAATDIGVNSNPRTGGVDDHIILYEFWPGVPAVLNGETFPLISRVS